MTSFHSLCTTQPSFIQDPIQPNSKLSQAFSYIYNTIPPIHHTTIPTTS
uniref:Uncharacterized protein n=1 Tax=Anguilla anguilla TaxID=7936 RepID=A0A0E9WLW2_ANGAN